MFRFRKILTCVVTLVTTLYFVSPAISEQSFSLEVRDYDDFLGQIGFTILPFKGENERHSTLVPLLLRYSILGLGNMRAYDTEISADIVELRSEIPQYEPQVKIIPAKRVLGRSLLPIFFGWQNQLPSLDVSEDFAIEIARENRMQGVIWGDFEPVVYKDRMTGFAIKTKFVFGGNYNDYRSTKLEYWEISSDGTVQYSVGLPSVSYAFPIVFLSTDELSEFCMKKVNSKNCTQEPHKIVSKLISVTKNKWTAKQFKTGDLYEVIVPKTLSESNAASITSGFLAMLLSYLKGDWQRVIDNGEKVLKQEPDLKLKVDTLLLIGAAKYRSGRDGQKEIDLAMQLSPFSRSAAQYKRMSLFQLLKDRKIPYEYFQNKISEMKDKGLID